MMTSSIKNSRILALLLMYIRLKYFYNRTYKKMCKWQFYSRRCREHFSSSFSRMIFYSFTHLFVCLVLRRLIELIIKKRKTVFVFIGMYNSSVNEIFIWINKINFTWLLKDMFIDKCRFYSNLVFVRLISSVCFMHIKQLLLLCLSCACCRYSIKIIVCACMYKKMTSLLLVSYVQHQKQKQ